MRDFVREENHLKIPSQITPEVILALGGRKLSSTYQEDIFLELPSGDVVRLRKEGDKYFLSQKSTGAGGYVVVREKPISEQEYTSFFGKGKEVVRVNKKREAFLVDGASLFLDSVERLGHFVEFDVSTPSAAAAVKTIMSQLSLDYSQAFTKSYFDIAQTSFSPFIRVGYRLHGLLGTFSFGVSSAVITTLGVIIGLYSATSSFLAVISGVSAVAIADSFSDAFAMYMSKRSEPGSTIRRARSLAVSTFVGKFVFAFTFIIPFLFLSFGHAFGVSIVWGILLIFAVSAGIAFAQEESFAKTAGLRLLLAAFVLLAAYFAGTFIERLVT